MLEYVSEKDLGRVSYRKQYEIWSDAASGEGSFLEDWTQSLKDRILSRRSQRSHARSSRQDRSDRNHSLTKEQQRDLLTTRLLIAGIVLCVLIFFSSALYLVHPYTSKDVKHAAFGLLTAVSDQAHAAAAVVTDGAEAIGDQLASVRKQIEAIRASREAEEAARREAEAAAAALESQKARAESAQEAIASRNAARQEPIFDGPMPYVPNNYNKILDTSMGPMLYFSQRDSHWSDFLYGGHDPISSYGCGPTALAMIINSFGSSDAPVAPTDLAIWAANHGEYAEGHGSYHTLIPDALKAYGLNYESVSDRSELHVKNLLASGHLLVVLMGPGTFTDGGHFMIITGMKKDGTVTIADPNSYINTIQNWDLSTILDELMWEDESGAPMWAVSR